MHHGKLVFAQLMEHLPLHTFRRCVARYPSRYPTLKLSHLDQFLCMAFALGSMPYIALKRSSRFAPKPISDTAASPR